MTIYKTILLIILLLLIFPATLLYFFIPSLLIRGINKYKTYTKETNFGCLISTILVLIYFTLTYYFIATISETWIKILIALSITSIAYYITIPLIIYAGKIYLKTRKIITPQRPRMKYYNYKYYKYFSILSFLTSLCLFIYSCNYPNNEFSPFVNKFIIVFIGIGIMLYRYPNSYNKEIESIDKLPVSGNYVLLLRSFADEFDSFYYGFYLDEFGPTIEELRAKYSTNNVSNVNLEIFLSYQIKKNIGELIGLGNPKEIQPHETMRLLYTMENWEEKLVEFMKISKCIIMLPSVTKNIHYEIQQIFKMKLHLKFYVLTRPRANSFLKRYGRLLIEFCGYKKAVKWNDFQKQISEAGLVCKLTPKHGCVIGFNEDFESYIVDSNLQKPSEYVHSMRRDLSNKKLL